MLQEKNLPFRINSAFPCFFPSFSALPLCIYGHLHETEFQLLGVLSVAVYRPSEFISPYIAFIPAPISYGVPSGRRIQMSTLEASMSQHCSVTLMVKCKAGAWALRRHCWAAPPCILWGSVLNLLMNCQLPACVWSAGSSGWSCTVWFPCFLPPCTSWLTKSPRRGEKAGGNKNTAWFPPLYKLLIRLLAGV